MYLFEDVELRAVRFRACSASAVVLSDYLYIGGRENHRGSPAKQGVKRLCRQLIIAARGEQQ